MLLLSMGRPHVRFAPRQLLDLLLCLIAASGLVLVGIAEAAPLKVRVRGTAKLTARGSRDQSPIQPGATELVLSGSLTDDAGQPLALQSIVVRLAREADGAKVAEGIRAARGCDSLPDRGEPSPRRGPSAWGVRVTGPVDAPEIVLVTDEAGRFCFRAPIFPDRYRAHLVYVPKDGGALVDGVEREIVFDLTKGSVALRFDPTPRVLQLDQPHTTIEAVATRDDEEGVGTTSVAPGLDLVLANEKEEIARAVTDTSGRARFSVPGVKLGPPGVGELRVSFAGDGETARASHTEDVERHVKVAVTVLAAERGELKGGVPEDGIPLTAEVASSLGPVSEGSVEARVGEVVVGAAPVERGIARLTLTFTAHGEEALVRLRYVPASPWYEPQGELTVRVPVRGPGVLSKAPILLAGLAVLAFFLVGRLSAQKAKPTPQPPKVEGDAPREAKPRMEVVRRAERGDEGWTGRVLDVHEGTPVAGARVWVERGTFESKQVVASTETDAAGRFALPGIGRVAGDERLSAEARLHARLTRDLPAPSEIEIALEARKRALLARLVGWARRRGPPFDVRPEPTPGHVRRVASDDAAVARWADALERVAFGPGDVDARAEQEVESLAPADPRRDGEREAEIERRERPARAVASERRRSDT
jgi:5-hydroxyisourate hydrolase-like protein (transthyretin family)